MFPPKWSSASPKELVRLDRQLVALLVLLADGEQAHVRTLHAEDLLCEHRAHVGELEEVLGPCVRIGARVDEDALATPRRDHDGDSGTVNSRHSPDVEQRRRQHRPRVAGGHDDVGVTVPDRADRAYERRVRLRPDRLDGVLVHCDRLGRLHERKPVRVERSGTEEVG